MALEYLDHCHNARLAVAFVDYMKLQQLPVILKPASDGGVELWVPAEQQPQALAEYKLFLANPADPKYMAASWQTGDSDLRLRYTNSAGYMQRILSHATPVSMGFVLLCVLMYLLQHIPAVYQLLQFYPEAITQQQQYWRWFTPSLFHLNLIHLSFNMLVVWFLACQLERQQGRLFILMFLLFIGLISNFAQFMLQLEFAFSGSSAIVYGLIAYCWLYPKIQQKVQLVSYDGLFYLALFWLSLGAFDLMASFDFYARLSGLLAGLLFAAVRSRF